MTEEMTPSLVARLRDGEAAAADLLEELYRRPLVRFATSYVDSREEAEDAVQDVFCKVLAAGAVPDDFRAWIYRIARNHCLNLRRARGRRRDGEQLPEGFDVPGTLRGELTQLGERERRARLGAALGALGSEEREALVLRYGEGLARDEIARVLDLSVTQVKSRLFEGLARLRRHASLG